MQKILKNESFAVEFFDKILGMDFYKGFYSDETYLEHFYCDVDDDKKERKNKKRNHRKGKIILWCRYKRCL